MSIINTNKLLKEFVKKRKELTPKHYFQLQREMICEPVAEHLKMFSGIQLQQYFLANGLFYPDAKIIDDIKEFERKNILKHMEQDFQTLKKYWDGTDATIFLFPVEARNSVIMKELNGMMGVSFHHLIIMFLSKSVKRNELKALLTHEYNHVCRLAVLEKDFDELTLLDSMIIEGMGEIAVGMDVGKENLAPWVSLYTKDQLRKYWAIVGQYLHVKGKENHDPILYGDKTRGRYPKWLGYCLGYQIIQDFIEEQPMTMKELLRVPSIDILQNSSFRM